MCIKSIRNFLKMKFTRTEISAVHEYDLMELLISINVYDNLIAGKYQCMNCGNQINLENLWGIKKLENNYKFICDNPVCISEETVENR